MLVYSFSVVLALSILTQVLRPYVFDYGSVERFLDETFIPSS